MVNTSGLIDELVKRMHPDSVCTCARIQLCWLSYKGIFTEVSLGLLKHLITDGVMPDAAAGAPTVAEDAPAVDEGDQAIPALVQAPQQPPPPPHPAARTVPQRLGRLEEDVKGLRRDVGSLRGLVERLMTDQGRYVPIFVGTFSVMTDFAVLEDMDAYHDERMSDIIVGEPFLREVRIKTKRLEGIITFYNGDDEVTYQM
ncbi:hypothetical protein Tco_0990925, partial [Tanacetum coccineum]